MDGIIWVPSWPWPTWDACDRKARALEDAQEASEAYLWRRDALRFEPRHFFWNKSMLIWKSASLELPSFIFLWFFPSIFTFINFNQMFINFLFSSIFINFLSSMFINFHHTFIQFYQFSFIFINFIINFSMNVASFLVKCSSILIYCPNLFFPGTASSRTKIPAEEEQRAQQLRRVLRSESEASEVGAVQLKNSPRECRLFFKQISI